MVTHLLKYLLKESQGVSQLAKDELEV